jgi:lipopolysaccharide transport system permease protein
MAQNELGAGTVDAATGVAEPESPPQSTSEAPAKGTPPTVVIEASRGWRALNLGEIWVYRELLQNLVLRDVTVRYKQTVLGAAWAIVQPLFTMVVFTVIFGGFAKMDKTLPPGLPYPVFSFTALVPWAFFSTGLTRAATSLVGSSYLLKKVYMPRLILPMASVFGPIIDFFIAFCFLLGLMAFMGFVPALTTPLMLLFLLLALTAGLGTSLWLSALNVQFRDIGHAIPFVVQMWMYATPIAYPSTVVPEPYRTLQYLNPMTAVVNGFRWCVLGIDTCPTPVQLSMSVSVAVVMLITGVFIFKRMERTFADVV